MLSRSTVRTTSDISGSSTGGPTGRGSGAVGQHEVMEELSNAPVRTERYSHNHIPVDIEGEANAQRLAKYLADAQSNDQLVYETGRI